MSSGTAFPVFIRPTYDPSGNAFPELTRQGKEAADQVARHFQGSMDQVSRAVSAAMAAPRNGVGALDLGAGKYREAAQAAEQRAAALRQVAAAAQQVAAREGALSGAQQVVIAQTREASLAADAYALKLQEQANVFDRLQAEMNQTAVATGQLAGVNRTAATASGAVVAGASAQRMAMIGVGQQTQDAVIQLQMGTAAMTVFAQQGSQMAFQLSNMKGRVGDVAKTLAGPWGTALFVGTSLLGAMTAGLWDNEKAAGAAESAADGLAIAQSALAGMFDFATGAVLRNNEAMRINARIKAITLREEARSAREGAVKTLETGGQSSVSGRAGALRAGIRFNPAALVTGRVGDAIQFDAGGFLKAEQALQARAKAQADLLNRLAARDITREKAIQLADKLDYTGLKLDKKGLRGAIQDIAGSFEKDRAASDLDQVLDTGKLPAHLRKLTKPTKPRKERDGTAAAQRLEEFGEDTADKIEEIGQRFAKVPPQVQSVTKAVNDLDDVIDDLNRRKPPGFEKLVAQAEQTKSIVQKAADAPYQDYLKAQIESFDLQQLINAGKTHEAEAVRTIADLERSMGPLGAEREAIIRSTTVALAEQARQTEALRARQQLYLSALEDVRGNIQSTIENMHKRGLKSVGDFVSGLRGTFNHLNAEILTDNLFGGVFKEMENWITGRDVVQEANKDYAESMLTAREAVLQHAAAMEADANALAKTRDAKAPELSTAKDALASFLKVKDQLVVTAGRLRDPSQFVEKFATKLLPSIRPGISAEDAEALGKQIGKTVSSAFKGAAYGQAASGMLLGSGGSATGAAVGGALGKMAGKELGETFAKQLGSFAKHMGPIGSIIGGLAGGLIGKAFTPAKRGSATIDLDAGGNLKVASVSGNSTKFKQAAGDSADSAIATVERIAEQLGATLTGAGSVSIGVRDGKYRVDTSGQGITKTKRGAIDFGEDAAAAVKAATLDLIKDGILGGLRAGTQKLLQNAKDLEAGLDKAMRFEAVFTSLKQHLDPVGAAVDEVEKRFTSLRKLFGEASASAEELAQLEQLYGIERKKAVEDASNAMTSTLKGLIADLTGNNDAFSLRTRLEQARATYDPLAADVAAGKKVDYEAFAEATRAVEAIMRALEGSQSGYFEFVDQATGLASKALAEQQALIGAAAGAPGAPGGIKPPNDTTPVVSAVDRLSTQLGGILNGQLTAVNDNLATLILQNKANKAGGSAPGADRLRYVVERLNF